MVVNFESNTFSKRFKSMIKVDFRRMFKSKLFYILIACAFVIPILITVMMTMMDGSVSVNPQTGVETVMEGPENAWQSIGTLPTENGEAMGGMDVMSMCNINMMFMMVWSISCIGLSTVGPVSRSMVSEYCLNTSRTSFCMRMVQSFRWSYG